MTPQQRFYQNNKELCRERVKACYYRNLEKSREKGRDYWKVKLAKMSPEELRDYRQADTAKAKKRYFERKDKIFAAYGGYVCKCCGELEKSFLSVDHINNNAQQMIRDGLHKRGSASFYNWLIKNNFPKGFQILCMNCQFGKKNNSGVCPHQVKV